MIWFNSHNTVKQALSSPICREENSCLERVSNLTKVTNLINENFHLNSSLSFLKAVLLFTRAGLSAVWSALLCPPRLAHEVLSRCLWLLWATMQKWSGRNGNSLARKAKGFIAWSFTEEVCAPCSRIYWRHRPQGWEGWGRKSRESCPSERRGFHICWTHDFLSILHSNATGLLWDCTTPQQGPNLNSASLWLVNVGLVLLLLPPYLLSVPVWWDG